MPVCSYCANEAVFTLKNGNACCCKYATQCPANRHKNSVSIERAHKDGRCRSDQLSAGYGWNKGLCFASWETASKGAKRRRLITERGHRCERCGNNEWMGQPIMLECHNHRLAIEDAQLLCPNCHAQTDNWRKKKTSF